MILGPILRYKLPIVELVRLQDLEYPGYKTRVLSVYILMLSSRPLLLHGLGFPM